MVESSEESSTESSDEDEIEEVKDIKEVKDIDDSVESTDEETESEEEISEEEKVSEDKEAYDKETEESSDETESSDEKSNDDSTEADCREISDQFGNPYYYEEPTNIVYEPVGEGTGEQLGELTRVNDKDAPIHRNGNQYIVSRIINLKIKKTEKTCLMCAITKRAYFNDKYIGNVKENSKGEYILNKKSRKKK